MNRPSAITVATITAILFAGSATVSVYSYLKKQSARGFQGVTIATAATDIPVGTTLDRHMVKLVSWPKESLPTGYLADAGALQGRVAVRQLNTGDLVTEQKLMPRKGSAGTGVLDYLVPPGHRAVTVAVNEVTGVAGFLTPQSRVDVVLVTPKPGATDKDDRISKLILQNVPVLASGQVTEQKDGKPSVLPTVTLDVAPADAEKLALGVDKKDSLQLLLRNVTDTASVETRGATVSRVLNGGEALVIPTPPVAKTVVRVREVRRTEKVQAKALPAPAPKYEMEIIKGGSKTRGEFSQE